uniref:RNA polymerase subunit alpha n=1 Tax=Neustupella aerophytica TaxID=2962111 RepID=UPI0021822D8D|nr:RNA polymerase subunit alpha [Neustupella aerophytica]UVI61070.1 RNA polymerase subunit alpha [Neustupella aerophytica]
MKFEKPKLVIEIEKRTIDKRTGHISFQFRIGPFKKTMATTIGSALRRTLLSMTKTLAITSVCGNFHEGNCIREDLFELSLNLQHIHIKSSFFPYIGIGRLRKKGPAIITAKDLQLEEGLEVVNPNQYICTVNESYTINLALMINSPKTNQGTDYIDPLNPINFIKKNSIKNRELQFDAKSSKRENFFQIYDDLNKRIDSKSNQEISTKTKNEDTPSLKSIKNIKSDNSTKSIKDTKIRVGIPQKLPIDIVVVDPIYSALQSCGFEVLQTTNSSVAEYEELIKRGLSYTDEFLRFVVVSRGGIEPAVAVESAVQELKETLSILEPLPHIFASEKNLLLSLERNSSLMINNNERQRIISSYTLEILKNLDIKHLKLPDYLELFLRREGFISINNLVSVPLEFLKRIGLNKIDVNLIEESLNLFGLSLNISKNLKWEIVPSSLSF